MKYLFLFTIFGILNTLNAQSLYLGTGYFFDHYRPVSEKSIYHSKSASFFWAFLGGTAAYNFDVNYNLVKELSIYGNFYPLMFGSDLRKYPDSPIFSISQDYIAPELGIISYFSPVSKTKHKVDLGLGVAFRFVVSPITGAQSSYITPGILYEGEHIQKRNLATLIPLDFRYTFNFRPQLGLYISLKRTFGIYRWIEHHISYEIYDFQSNQVEIGSATMASYGSRSLIELGLVFNLKKN